MIISAAKKRKEELRNAWHTTATALVIAQRFGMSEGALRMFWTREKNAGRLPEGPRRCDASLVPFVAVEVRVPANDDDLDDDLDDAIEDKPRGPRRDHALAALRECHPGYDCRAYNTIPRAVLDAEIGKFERGDPLSEALLKVGGLPTPRMLREMARAHDRVMRAEIAAGRINP